jgi:hypothetical protein
MKRTIILLAVIATTLAVKAQTPEQHVFYDTVKTVKERVDFTPDTIPVFFKELGIGKPNQDGSMYAIVTTFSDGSTIYEKWNKGFVVWQTYVKSTMGVFTSDSSGSIGYLIQQDWYKNEYEESKSLSGTFLYADKKTKVTNKVIYSIKR